MMKKGGKPVKRTMVVSRAICTEFNGVMQCVKGHKCNSLQSKASIVQFKYYTRPFLQEL